MEATRKKSFWIIIILMFLAVVVIRILWPAQKTERDANLLIISDMETPVGTISVDFARWDGSQVSQNALGADGDVISRGESFYFYDVGWPAIVTIYTDPKGNEVLTQLYIEQAPEAQCRWVATLYDGDDGISLSMESVPMS